MAAEKRIKKKINFIQAILLTLITVMLTSTFSYTTYALTLKPGFYSHFVDLGNKFLADGKYDEAVLNFDKALKIEDRSTQARLGKASGLLNLGDVDGAVALLKEAQQIDFDNAELLEYMLNLICDADPDAAYELLMNYVNGHEGDLDKRIKEIYETAKEEPVVPTVIPPSGDYVKPFVCRFKSDKVRIGHKFYYTTDGKEPNQKSTAYRNGISIDDDTDITAIGYNPKGDSSDSFEISYTIDSSSLDKLNENIKTAEDKLANTEEGTQVGNCLEGSKDDLQEVLDSAKETSEKTLLTVSETKRVNNELEEAITAFDDNTIVATDRAALESEISKAQSEHDAAQEGNTEGQFRSGAKQTLQDAIDEAKDVDENLVARQDAIDEATQMLTDELEAFGNKKVTQIDVIMAQSGASVGPVTVSLLWHTTDDLDLHVTSPDGDTVYYGNTHSRSGGILDVDRQVNSYVENPVENIYWSNPPSGTYTVSVNVFSKRSTGIISGTVQVLVNGEAKLYDFTIDNGTKQICTINY
jgi:tetratricopeptide (TPR) repeat protein